MSASFLPPPLVPPEVDLRDMPLPHDLFVELAVAELGMDRAAAIALVHECVTAFEASKRRRAC